MMRLFGCILVFGGERLIVGLYENVVFRGKFWYLKDVLHFLVHTQIVPISHIKIMHMSDPTSYLFIAFVLISPEKGTR